LHHYRFTAGDVRGIRVKGKIVSMFLSPLPFSLYPASLGIFYLVQDVRKLTPWQFDDAFGTYLIFFPKN
jgi:hypothetical protein